MRLLRPAAVPLACLLALFLLAADGPDADGDPYVEVTATTGTEGNGVLVEGAVAFGGTQLAGTDASGDAIVPGIGTDFTGATLQQDGTDLVATIEIDDAVPGLHGAPEAVQYGWDITVDGSEYSLSAWRSATWQSQSPGTEVFSVQTCAPDPDTGQSTCVSDPVEGEFTETHLRWIIPLDKLDAGPGTEVAPMGVIHATPGAAGRVWFNPGAASLDEMRHVTLFTIGGGVEVDLLDTNGSIVESELATIATDGSFTASFADVAPGDYTIRATSSYADVEATVELALRVEEN